MTQADLPQRSGPLYVGSEFGHLRRVLVHRPGRELATMTPENKDDFLFDDLIYNPVAMYEHAAFSAVLGVAGAEVVYLTDLLAEVLHDGDVRSQLTADLCALEASASPVALAALGAGHGLVQHHANDCGPLEELLGNADDERLIDLLIAGHTCDDDYTDPFDFAPIPNLMFMRDSAAVVGGGVVLGNMARQARRREPLLLRYAYQHSPRLWQADGPPPFWFDRLSSPQLVQAAHWAEPDERTIEGGDVLVLRDDVLLIGCSERTSQAGIDALAASFANGGPVRRIYVLLMPRQRATMHLDTIFTLPSEHECLIYPPLILSSDKRQDWSHLPEGDRTTLLRIEIGDGAWQSHEDDHGLLAAVGRELHGDESAMTPIFCGGATPLHQKREQWTDGANVFTLRPGLVVGYERNERTYDALSAAGYEVVAAEQLLTMVDGQPRLHPDANTIIAAEDYSKKYAIRVRGEELSRARGGPRCMTQPLLRD